MRFPARYTEEVRQELESLRWNLPPCTGEPQIEVVFRELPFVSNSVFDLMEGLCDEQPPMLSGAEVCDE